MRRLVDDARLAYRWAVSVVRFATEAAPAPFSASFAVTDRCNLECGYCSCPYADHTELPLADVARLLARFREMGVARLGLVGGEPMLRRDLSDVIALAKAHGFVVCVNTNLTLYGRFPERLAGADLVFTSLDGDAAAHRANRGARSYDGVLDAIRTLVAAGTPVVAICVVTERNLDQADGLLAQAEALGIRVHFQPVCTGGPAPAGYAPDVPNEAFRAFFRRLLAHKRAGRPVASSRGYLAHMAAWEDFRTTALHDPTTRCAAGRAFLYVDPRGGAFPCPYTRTTTPVDLLATRWEEAWSGETPCTRCNVGPMVEFNLLVRHPLGAALDVWRSYARR
jgi:MoaA/NifB/PqqE/SkfB family radical SAM enzyme